MFQFPADIGKAFEAKMAAKDKALAERTDDEILTLVIADLSALPPRTSGNEAVHQQALAALCHLQGRLRKGRA